MTRNDQRRTSRVYPGRQQALIEFRQPAAGVSSTGILLNESAHGLAFQVRKVDDISVHDELEVCLGDEWRGATVRRIERQGIYQLVAVEWTQPRDHVVLAAMGLSLAP